MEWAQAVVSAARRLRTDYGLVKQRPHVYVATSDAAKAAVVSGRVAGVGWGGCVGRTGGW